jgi:hypothetical protein
LNPNPSLDCYKVHQTILGVESNSTVAHIKKNKKPELGLGSFLDPSPSLDCCSHHQVTIGIESRLVMELEKKNTKKIPRLGLGPKRT